LLEPILLDLSFYTILLVNPGITIHTANAFSQIIPALPLKRVNDIVRQPLSTWKDELKNDFEEAVFGQYPEIRNIRDELYQAGAIYASLSGSGSTVYGIFEKEKKPEFSFPAHYFTRQLTG
jgi:4-diphosphocytidyl-2-C-methyl-D-erythritol kinase